VPAVPSRFAFAATPAARPAHARLQYSPSGGACANSQHRHSPIADGSREEARDEGGYDAIGGAEALKNSVLLPLPLSVE
jgi:hypothetical protein